VTETALPDLGDADPVAIVLDWLKNHPRLGEVLGGPEHVSGISESPWPHLWCDDGPGGDLRTLDVAEFEVLLHLTDAPNGATGPSLLSRKLRRLVAWLVQDLASDDALLDTPWGVVLRVRPSGTFAETSRSTGQPEYTAGILLVVAPPLA
jgi:hypothetical protein